MDGALLTVLTISLNSRFSFKIKLEIISLGVSLLNADIILDSFSVPTSRLFIWNKFVYILDNNVRKEVQLYYPELDFKDHLIYEPQKGIHLRHTYYEWNFLDNCKNQNSIWKLI